MRVLDLFSGAGGAGAGYVLAGAEVVREEGEPRVNSYAIAAEGLVALNEWIDTAPANAARDAEARTWGRLAKVSEEVGEVIAAYIGATGQNPRKGTTGDMDAVRKELLDVALTALCAVEHLDGGAGRSLGALSDHIAWVRERALGPVRAALDGGDEMADVLAVAFETDGNGCDHGEPACSDCLARIALRTIREGRTV